VVTGGLMAAEEVIDLQTTNDVFQGKVVPVTTGRVLLHALGSDGQPLCGREETLTPIERPWDAAYLPHLPRCAPCAVGGAEPAEAADPDRPATPPGQPAATVDVRLAHGTDNEEAAAGALRAVLAEYDLRRWMFTDLVTVDESIRGGYSHPLTISTRILLQRPACALTTFLHEQLHWIEGPNVDAATTRVRERWPDPPPSPAGGHDAESTWLHLWVCALEYFSLAEHIGAGAAQAELRQHTHYSWIYEQVLSDPGWFSALCDRHELRVPDEPPVPRRYYGEEWWTSLV
jgi:hypothetical protein